MMSLSDSGAGWGGAILNVMYCNEEPFGWYTLYPGEQERDLRFCMPPQVIIRATDTNDEVAWRITASDGSVLHEGSAPFEHSTCANQPSPNPTPTMAPSPNPTPTAAPSPSPTPTMAPSPNPTPTAAPSPNPTTTGLPTPASAGPPGSAGNRGPPGPPGADGPEDCGDWAVNSLEMRSRSDSGAGWGGAVLNIMYCNEEPVGWYTLYAGETARDLLFCMPPQVIIRATDTNDDVDWTIRASDASMVHEGGAPFEFSSCD